MTKIEELIRIFGKELNVVIPFFFKLNKRMKYNTTSLQGMSIPSSKHQTSTLKSQRSPKAIDFF